MTTEAITRWGVSVPHPKINGLLADNFGILTLDGQHHLRYGFGGPPWEWSRPDRDTAPAISFLPENATAVTYMLPPELPIHIVPPVVDPSSIFDQARRLSLYAYRWGRAGGRRVEVLAAYAPEIHAWWIGGAWVR